MPGPIPRRSCLYPGHAGLILQTALGLRYSIAGGLLDAGFHKWIYPEMDGFIMGTLNIEMDDLGYPPILGNLHIIENRIEMI